MRLILYVVCYKVHLKFSLHHGSYIQYCLFGLLDRAWHMAMEWHMRVTNGCSYSVYHAYEYARLIANVVLYQKFNYIEYNLCRSTSMQL